MTAVQDELAGCLRSWRDRLGPAEAGLAEPSTGTINRHVGPGVQRLLDRLSDVPVMVIDASWQVVAANPLASALVGDLSGASGRERNLAWRHFTGAPSRLVRSQEEA